MVPSDVTWHQPKQTNNGAKWRHAARKWTAQLSDKCTLLHDFELLDVHSLGLVVVGPISGYSDRLVAPIGQ